MNRTRRQAIHGHRGIAMVIVLSMVVLVSLAIAFAITVANRDGSENAKQIHNLTVQNVTEGAMQMSRNFFSTHAKEWDKYLALSYPPSKTATPGAELWPTVPAGFSCYMYARDDDDELPPAPNDPTHDNNHVIYVGAVCTGPNNTTAEVTGVLQWDDSQFVYRSQYSGGTSGLNNTFTSTNQVGP